MQFHLVPAFEQKPMPNQTNETPEAKPDPFGNPEKDFILTETEHHYVQLNKFCAVCPQMLLFPKQYAPQAERLELQDFVAAWDILGRLGETSYLGFYNCGIESGSSQSYRHIQIIPVPDPEEFQFFPDKPSMRSAIALKKKPLQPPPELSIPFFCLVASTNGMSPEGVHVLYQTLLTTCETMLEEHIDAHNLIFTVGWICIVPRRRASIGQCAANSMGMMGLIWVGSQEEREEWNSLGLSKHLTELGYPITNVT